MSAASREPLRPVLWDASARGGRLLDQRRLPHEEVWLTLVTAGEVAERIRTLTVRGAPSIGAAAAYVLAAEALRGV